MSEKKARDAECNKLTAALATLREQLPGLRKDLSESCGVLTPVFKEMEVASLESKQLKEVISELEEEIEGIEVPKKSDIADEIHLYEYMDPFVGMKDYEPPSPMAEPMV